MSPAPPPPPPKPRKKVHNPDYVADEDETTDLALSWPPILIVLRICFAIGVDYFETKANVFSHPGSVLHGMLFARRLELRNRYMSVRVFKELSKAIRYASCDLVPPI
eukprot:3473029-Amphidinium_carterae.1